MSKWHPDWPVYWGRHAQGKMQNSPESYARWRATIPYTQEQIAAALLEAAEGLESLSPYVAEGYRRSAAWVTRTGRLYKAVLVKALAHLVKTCDVPDEAGKPCGKKALYRAGTSGRCSAHRLVTNEWILARRRRMEEKSIQISDNRKDRDTHALRSTGPVHKRKGDA
jgi:hypothetical protein